jgi:hypothetical protein
MRGKFSFNVDQDLLWKMRLFDANLWTFRQPVTCRRFKESVQLENGNRIKCWEVVHLFLLFLRW